jgi:hypothetical protein
LFKTKYKFDIELLKNWYSELCAKFDPEETCSHGQADSYYHKFFEPGSVAIGWHLHTAEGLKNKPFRRSRTDNYDQEAQAYRSPSKYMFGYINVVLKSFPEAFRANVYTLMPGTQWRWHSDTPGSFRMVISISTNTESYFQYQNENKFEIPSDGYVYAMFTEKVHRAGNLGLSERAHLIWSMPNSLKEKYLEI